MRQRGWRLTMRQLRVIDTQLVWPVAGSACPLPPAKRAPCLRRQQKLARHAPALAILRRPGGFCSTGSRFRSRSRALRPDFGVPSRLATRAKRRRVAYLFEGSPEGVLCLLVALRRQRWQSLHGRLLPLHVFRVASRDLPRLHRCIRHAHAFQVFLSSERWSGARLPSVRPVRSCGVVVVALISRRQCMFRN